MIANILLIILFVGLSIWLMLQSIINENTTKSQICINIALWMLGFYIGLGVYSLFKFI